MSYRVYINPPDFTDYLCVFEGTRDECEAFFNDCLEDGSYEESYIWVQSWNGECV